MAATVKNLTDFNGNTVYPNTLASAVLNDDGTSVKGSIENLQNSKAGTNSPAFTGTPTAPTADKSTNNTQIATTAFVHSLVGNTCVIGATKPTYACIWFDTSQ